MGKVFRAVSWGAGSLMVLAAVAIPLTIGWRPLLGPRERPLTERVFDRTPERLARGRYLVEHVAGCLDCHSPRDWKQYGAPGLPGMAGAGQIFPVKGLPGRVVAANITPDRETGIGAWSDDELARAIREGIGRDGHALFPLMPYRHFRHLSDEDLASVIVYLRSMPAVHNPLPATALVFPVKYLIRSVPEPLNAPVPPPDLSAEVKRGAYLTEIAGCSDCHTPMDNHGRPIESLAYAGGQIFEGPWGRVASANLTLDSSGIAHYDPTTFLQAMRTGYVGGRALSPLMPWSSFRGMTTDDLLAIFAYLKTLPPVRHFVDNTDAPTFCRVCKQTHGLGSSN
jgi:mono/diheme cytochrome c family protein